MKLVIEQEQRPAPKDVYINVCKTSLGATKLVSTQTAVLTCASGS